MGARLSKAAWREIGGKRIFARSKWEANYGYYLQWQKEKEYIKDWAHEPHIFRFEGLTKGVTTYKPDFRVDYTDGSREWVEVKGYMDTKSSTKIKRFKKYFPDEVLKVVDAKWFKKNNEKMKIIIKGWE